MEELPFSYASKKSGGGEERGDELVVRWAAGLLGASTGVGELICPLSAKAEVSVCGDSQDGG